MRTEERFCGDIYGKLWLPDAAERPPLAIFAHEVGCTHASAQPWAEHLAGEGWAVYAPDFRGGSEHGRSPGATTDMSALTEADDLAEVFAAAAAWGDVDGARPLLIGASQGGFSAAIYAGRNPERVRALILLYPGFNMPDALRAGREDPAEVPETFDLHGWLTVGRRYFTALWNYYPWAEALGYPGRVLILHGAKDALVPPEYSRRAAEGYARAELCLHPTAAHMFRGEEVDWALERIDRFLRGL